MISESWYQSSGIAFFKLVRPIPRSIAACPIASSRPETERTLHPRPADIVAFRRCWTRSAETLDAKLDLNPASALEGKRRFDFVALGERLHQVIEHDMIAARREPNGSVCGDVEAVLQFGHCHHAAFRLHFMNLDPGEIRRTARQPVGSVAVVVDDEIAIAYLGPFGRRARPRLVNSDAPPLNS
jgi:hypothetical protein